MKQPKVLDHRTAVELAKRADRPIRIAIAVLISLVVVAAAAIITSLLDSEPKRPVEITRGPDYNEVPVRRRAKPTASQPEPAPTTPVSAESRHDLTAADNPDEHKIRLLPNLFGSGAVEDGRVYSVALIAKSADVPVGTVLFAQGKVDRFANAGSQSRPYAVLKDEETDDRLICAMMPDEAAEVASLYHVGEIVSVSGEFMGEIPIGGNSAMPTLSDCKVAGARDKVVRPSSAYY